MTNMPTYNSRQLLRSWLEDIHDLRYEHASSARFYEKLHWKLGIPSVLLAALLSASIWSRDVPMWKDVATAAFMTEFVPIAGSIAVLLLNAIITFLGPSSRSNQHKSAYAHYDILFRELQCRLSSTEADVVPESFLNEFRIRWQKANEDAPTVRHSVLKRMDDRARTALHWA